MYEIFSDKKKKLNQLKIEYLEKLGIFLSMKKKKKEEENYYKLLRVDNFWSNNYVEYESNGDRNKTLPVEEYLNKINPRLKAIINNLKKSDTKKFN